MAVTAIAWGTAPDWIAGVGTALAFGGTFWLLLLQRGELKRSNSDRMQAAARKVTAWWDEGRSDVRYRNASDEAIYDMTLVARLVTAAESKKNSNQSPPLSTPSPIWGNGARTVGNSGARPIPFR